MKGKRSGRLTVLEKDYGEYWKCRCDCGKECMVTKEHLVSGHTRSCGCLADEIRKENFRKAIHFVNGTCIEKISDTKLFVNNTSGFRGVWKRANGKYRAGIGFQGKWISLGTFDTALEAAKARKQKEEELYGPVIRAFQGAHKEKKLEEIDLKQKGETKWK